MPLTALRREVVKLPGFKANSGSKERHGRAHAQVGTRIYVSYKARIRRPICILYCLPPHDYPTGSFPDLLFTCKLAWARQLHDPFL